MQTIFEAILFENGTKRLSVSGRKLDHLISDAEEMPVAGEKGASFLYPVSNRYVFNPFTIKRFLSFSKSIFSKIVFHLDQIRKRFSVNGKGKRNAIVPFSLRTGII